MNKQHIYKIIITTEMQERAFILANQVIKNLKPTPNYTNLSVKHRFHCGYLGELTFYEFLKEKNKKAIYRIKTTGESQTSEFILSTNMGERIADVKTACKSYHTRIMFPKAQKEIHNTNYYIGIKLNHEIGEIHGFCFFQDFQFAENGFEESKVPTYYQFLNNLNSIDSLLEKILIGETILQEIGGAETHQSQDFGNTARQTLPSAPKIDS